MFKSWPLKHVLSSKRSDGNIERQLKMSSLIESSQRKILEMIATGEPLPTVLEKIVLFIESLEEGLLGSILLLDQTGKFVKHGSAPHLPAEYSSAIDGQPIGPKAGSCGTAAYTGERVIVDDIETHPYWQDYKNVAIAAGLRSCWSTPIFSADNKVLGTFAIYRNIPSHPTDEELSWVDKATHLAAIAIERENFVNALRVSEERYRIVTEAASDPILGITETSEIIFANEAVQRVFGYDPKELLGKSLTILMPNELKGLHLQGLERYLQTGVRRLNWSHTDVRGRRKDGSEFPVEVAFGELSEGRTRIFSGVIRDVTARKEIEKALTQAKESAEAADRAKSAFIANISHELRTPLACILGFANLLGNGESTPQERNNFVDIIKRNGKLLNQVIDEVLDLSKIEAGEMTFQKVPTNLRDLISGVRTAFEQEAARKKLLLRVHFEEGVPEYVDTDPYRLSQIIMNLLGNAIKFTDRGEVKISVRPSELEPEAGKFVLIDVCDTGSGITPADSTRLFQKFSQIDSSFTRRHGGSGIGLVLARELAKGLGGNVELSKSIPGEGSVFTARIAADYPRQFASKRADLNDRDERPISAPAIENLTGVKVLLVEDSKDMQILIQSMLRGLKAKVDIAANGSEGISLADENDYDVVLMDLQMPILNGYDATRQLRDHGFEKPIIALSSHVLADQRSKAISSGCNEHLSKPIDERKLVSTIRRFL